MKVKVLGSGCAKCKKLYAQAEEAIAAAGLPVELEKVESLQEIAASGVLATPAIVIDGEVKSTGRIPPAAEIAAWIKAAAPQSPRENS